MAISRASIDRVIQAADIVGLVGDYVSLKKKGINWEACCPFHEEKTPSFKVNPVKGIYKCFGCGKGGDSISFMMDVDSLSYVEAIRSLARRFNVELEETESDFREEQIKQSEKDSLQIAANFAQEFFVSNLHETEEGRSIGMAYFLERGLRPDVIKAFGLGYARDEWDALLQEAEKKQYSRELLEKAGLILINEETHKTYDRFRGRITFPIYNVSGKVMAWGARMLGKDKNQPKYINSPESILFDKSNALYGLFQAKNAVRHSDMCYLTEGYMDVIAMHQAGVENTVASSGTSLTEGQIRLIGRFTKNLTLLYDGDKAGIKASLRGIDMILAAGLNVRAVVLPDGHDPDSYAKDYGSAALQDYLKSHIRDFISFKAELAAEEASSDPIKKAELLESILESISLVPDAVRRSIFLAEAARIFRMPEDTLHESLNLRVFNRNKRSRNQSETYSPTNQTGQNPSPVPVVDEKVKLNEADSLILELENALVRNLVLFGEMKIEEEFTVAKYILEEVADVNFQSELTKKVFEEYSDRHKEGHDVSPSYFLHHPEETLKRSVVDLCAGSYHLSHNWAGKFNIVIPEEEDLLAASLFKVILQLKRNHILAEIRLLEARMSSENEDEDEMVLLVEISKLKKKEIEFSGKLGSVINH